MEFVNNTYMVFNYPHNGSKITFSFDKLFEEGNLFAALGPAATTNGVQSPPISDFNGGKMSGGGVNSGNFASAGGEIGAVTVNIFSPPITPLWGPGGDDKPKPT